MRQAYDGISDFIFMEDPLEKASVILIPGGSHIQLVEKAADLYKLGYAPYILPSGSSNEKLKEHASEYDFIYNELVKRGVNPSAILKEDKAKHTFENASFSYQVLKNHGISTNKVILVCKSFHARRAYMSYKVSFPSNCQIIVAPVIDNKNIRKDNWFLEADKIKRVMSEVKKIAVYFESHLKSL